MQSKPDNNYGAVIMAIATIAFILVAIWLGHASWHQSSGWTEDGTPQGDTSCNITGQNGC